MRGASVTDCAHSEWSSREKMRSEMSRGSHVLMTTYLLFLMGSVAQRVYFDCGAKVDVVDVQGLILSPGFPYNYSSGTHCVWLFIVPVNYQLVLEIFDFDVFKSQDSAAQYLPEEEADEGMTFNPADIDADKGAGLQSDVTKSQQSSQDGEAKPGVKQSTRVEMDKGSKSAKRSTDVSSSFLLSPGTSLSGEEAVDSPSASDQSPVINPGTRSPDVEDRTGTSPYTTDPPAVSLETQQSLLDTCPHDVLYISDLITFSSRFCGSNRPPSSQLVFGSRQEMVEVIMELITTTHWGRGFALLFHYHNLTEPGRDLRASAPTASRVDSMLAAVSGAAFFAMILTSALCVIFRPKLCPKKSNSCLSGNSETPEGVQNPGSEVSELQLMTETQTNAETSGKQGHNNRDSRVHTAVSVDVSQNAAGDLSGSGLTELDLGSDEVFIVSSALSPPKTTFSPHARHPDPGPSSLGDWPSLDSSVLPTGDKPTKDSSGGCARPRAWSVRTFQDFLPPLPQLHKKWCSWNSSSPFTKLVDSAPPTLKSECRASDSRRVFSEVHLEAKADNSALSDSTISNASYPLAQAAQQQRRLNSTSNLLRSRFPGPCCGLLSGTAGHSAAHSAGHSAAHSVAPAVPKSQALSSESTSGSSPTAKVQMETRKMDFPGEGDRVSVPVFVISEEDDRQPLVSAELLDQNSSAPAALSGLVREKHEEEEERTGQGPVHQRARLEWRPRGSQVKGGVCPLSAHMF